MSGDHIVQVTGEPFIPPNSFLSLGVSMSERRRRDMEKSIRPGRTDGSKSTLSVYVGVKGCVSGNRGNFF